MQTNLNPKAYPIIDDEAGLNHYSGDADMFAYMLR